MQEKQKGVSFHDRCATHPLMTQITNEPVSCVFPQNCNSILQPLDQGTIRSFKHEYCKQHLTKIISVTDHQ